MVLGMVIFAVLSGLGALAGIALTWDTPTLALAYFVGGVVSVMFWAALAAILGNQQQVQRELAAIRQALGRGADRL